MATPEAGGWFMRVRRADVGFSGSEPQSWVGAPLFVPRHSDHQRLTSRQSTSIVILP
jgi:hypothetical protein